MSPFPTIMQIKEIINKVLSTPHAAFFYTPPFYGNSDSYLFLKPKAIVKIKSLRNIDESFSQIDGFIEKGLIGYSLLNYEAGYLFEKRLNRYLPKNENLIQFFFYDKKDLIKIKSSKIDFNFKQKFQIKNFKLNTTKNEFLKSIKKIKSYIEEGDTYQVNYTMKGKFNFEGSYSGLFSHLLFNQSARYIAIINNFKDVIISLSPELFFEIEKSKIISKPMKGTTKRGIETAVDSLIKYELENSEKNRAENVMIVDLIRNDLGKISKYGSVNVKNIFEVEKYESVYQMISTIESKLRKNIKLSDVLKNIYPCGSITGAPKMRTMEIINELEKEPRGIYTGGIGLIGESKITFNVPIRTLTINKKSGKGEIGLGSGIVWDSVASEEYEETKLKGKFLSQPEKPFEIFETMLLKDSKIFLLDGHLNRLQQSAEFFLFKFDKKSIEEQLEKIIKNIDVKSYRLRISLNKFGKLSYSLSILSELSKNIDVIVSTNRINSKNKFQYFKTTNRTLYNREYQKYSSKGFFDIIYLNEFNEVSEGAISNIFIYKNDVISTPPLSAGILGGVYRKHLLKNNSMIRERRLHINDLIEADKIILTNSLRGEVVVDRLFVDENEFIKFI
ncbi:MAG TPA: aminodeoxychorismate synthase component I [Ignavibacteriaceae bacterium]|nr:aminodeoxychorismate synthase component I [Ignavibacteriaceae bacterium]